MLFSLGGWIYKDLFANLGNISESKMAEITFAILTIIEYEI